MTRALGTEDVDAWLTAVADGRATMSQRRLDRLVASPGGLDAVCAAAVAKGVHLAVVVDDTGAEIVAASRHPIQILC